MDLVMEHEILMGLLFFSYPRRNFSRSATGGKPKQTNLNLKNVLLWNIVS